MPKGGRWRNRLKQVSGRTGVKVMDYTVYIRSLNVPPSIPSSPPPSVLTASPYLQFGEKLKYGTGVGGAFVPSDEPTTSRQNTVFASAGNREPGSTEWFWANTNGDWWDSAGTVQGTSAFATATISQNIAGQAVTWSGAGMVALIQKLLNERTAGIIIRTVPIGTKTGSQFCTKDNSDPALRPAFHIVTDQGTYDVGALRDIGLVAQSDPNTGFNATMAEPYLVIPDLTTVLGTVQSASMTLHTAASSQSIPCDYALFALKTDPLITDPVNQLGNVEYGLAATKENDLQLASDPAVLFYPSFANQAACEAAGWTNVDFAAGKPDLDSFQHVKEYGFNLMRIKSRYPGHPFSDGQTIISWRWPFPNTTTLEAYVRFLFRLSPEARDFINEGGVKLPGFEGGFNASQTTRFSYRAEHMSPSDANPHIYPLYRHAYDATHPQTLFSFASNRPLGNASVLAGTEFKNIYSFEFRVKLNTLSGGVWQSDGIDEAWINGVKVYSDLARKIIDLVADYGANYISNFFLNYFHGGQGNTPTGVFTADFGGIAVATQYIGPPPAQSLERDINANSWTNIWNPTLFPTGTNPGGGQRVDMQYSNCYQMPNGRQLEFNMAQHARDPGDNVGVRYVDYTSDAAPTGGYLHDNNDTNIAETDNLTTHYIESEGLVYYGGSADNVAYGYGGKVIDIDTDTVIWANVANGPTDPFYTGTMHEIVTVGGGLGVGQYRSVYNAAHMVNPDSGDSFSIDVGGGYFNNFPNGGPSVFRVLDRTSATKFFKLRVIRGLGLPTPTHMRHAVRIGNWLYWGGGGINFDNGSSDLTQDHRFFRVYIPDLVNSSIVTQEEITSRPALTSHVGLAQEQRIRFSLCCADKVRKRLYHLNLDGVFVYQVPDDDGNDGVWKGPFTFGIADWAETLSEGKVSGTSQWHGFIGSHRADLNQTFFRYNESKRFNRIRWAW